MFKERNLEKNYYILYRPTTNHVSEKAILLTKKITYNLSIKKPWVSQLKTENWTEKIIKKWANPAVKVSQFETSTECSYFISKGLLKGSNSTNIGRWVWRSRFWMQRRRHSWPCTHTLSCPLPSQEWSSWYS